MPRRIILNLQYGWIFKRDEMKFTISTSSCVQLFQGVQDLDRGHPAGRKMWTSRFFSRKKSKKRANENLPNKLGYILGSGGVERVPANWYAKNTCIIFHIIANSSLWNKLHGHCWWKCSLRSSPNCDEKYNLALRRRSLCSVTELPGNSKVQLGAHRAVLVVLVVLVVCVILVVCNSKVQLNVPPLSHLRDICSRLLLTTCAKLNLQTKSR